MCLHVHITIKSVNCLRASEHVTMKRTGGVSVFKKAWEKKHLYTKPSVQLGPEIGTAHGESEAEESPLSSDTYLRHCMHGPHCAAFAVCSQSVEGRLGVAESSHTSGNVHAAWLCAVCTSLHSAVAGTRGGYSQCSLFLPTKP